MYFCLCQVGNVGGDERSLFFEEKASMTNLSPEVEEISTGVEAKR